MGKVAPRGKPPWFSLLFLLLLAGALAAFAVHQRMYGLKPGDVTPVENRRGYALETTTIGGEPWKLADHAGRVLVVNYFATWCGPCREEFPDLMKIATEYKERGVDVAAVGVDTDDEGPGGAVGILKQFEMTEKPGFPILLPMKGEGIGEMIPYTYVLDKRGRVAYYMVGRFEDAHLRELLGKLVAEENK